MQTLMLRGIDGRHLWGFLCALGVLSLLDEHARAERLKSPRLAFDTNGTAVLHSPVVDEHLPAVLLARLRPLQTWLEEELSDVKCPGDFTKAGFECVASASEPRTASLLAGLACVVGNDSFESTLCAANGAGHQYLVQSMRDVLNLVLEDHIRAALFEGWRKAYSVTLAERRAFQLGSRKPTLRLDPGDERLYALRFSNPTTTDDFHTELGAQAIAIPSFALLPVVPSKRPVAVSSSRHGQRVTFSWSLWGVPATLLAARSLLWMGVGRPQLERERGVFAAFSADRVSGAKGKLSLSPSEGVW